jgi:hypothetical protein
VDDPAVAAAVAADGAEEPRTHDMNTNPPAIGRLLTLVAAFGTFCGCAGTGVSRPSATFPNPEAAMLALADVIGTHDEARIDALFGDGGIELLESGDEVADREDAMNVKLKIREKLAFEDQDATTKIAVIGNEAWPLPIPLVLEDGAWFFDVQAGKEEIENRRVGRNELSTLRSMHEYVDAQREYHAEGRDGEPQAYAKKVISSQGKHDGLFWPTAENEPESPFGPQIAMAAREGYEKDGAQPIAFHGYYYRTLTAQGARAPGGALSYLDDAGRLTRGFALLAWPAKYGSSGVMTFTVSARGIVYQKDLGEATETAAARIHAFDPDDSWDPTGG